jgi:hypothetical protein
MQVFMNLNMDETSHKRLDTRASAGIGKGLSMDRHLLNLRGSSGKTKNSLDGKEVRDKDSQQVLEEKSLFSASTSSLALLDISMVR